MELFTFNLERRFDMSLSWIDRIRYSPFFTQLVVTRKCNLSCAYCNEFDKTSEPVLVTLLKQRAGKLKELGAFSICLTGGEPTLHPDLPEMIRYCRRELRFFKTSMITNGFLLSEKMIGALNDAGLQDMQISIDGVKPNETTVKVLDSLRKRLSDLRKFARFNVVVSGVVGASNPEETFEVIRYARHMGFRPRYLLVHDHDGQVKLSADELKAYQKIKKMVGRHPFELSRYREEILTKGTSPFKCRAGSRYLYVDEEGIVSWCSQTRHVFRKPLMDYRFEDLRREFYTFKSCQDRCTLGCVRSASSVDGWRRQETIVSPCEQSLTA